jgi:exodeoxyribonuclease VII large subunit
VGELTRAIKDLLSGSFPGVWVKGELSGFKGAHPSGHLYFTLKDANAQLGCAMFKGSAIRLGFAPKDGLEVEAFGEISVYEPRGQYQLVVKQMRIAGIGALLAQLEELKRRLAADGLFDAARKQPLPFLPDVIGVITSPTGAVIRDILHRLSDRFPRHVMVWPVRVQGDGSADEVARAIAGFNALGPKGRIRRPDLIIVARGGGSLEDLWSFNEEIVVRTAAASDIPLISAVGHETDVTLIDFAADMRAPTPTAAAEMAVPVRSELIGRVDSLARRSFACWQRGQEARRSELRAAARALPNAEALLAMPRQRLDHAGARLPRALIANAQIHHRAFSRIAARLSPQTLRSRIARCCELVAALVERGKRAEEVARLRRHERLAGATVRLSASLRANAEAHRNRIARARERVLALTERGDRAMWLILEQREASVARCGQLLNALSHRGVLARGFALVRHPDGRPLRHAAAVSEGMRLDIEFSDGRVRARAEASIATPPEQTLTTAPRKPRSRRGGGAPGQGSLFEP